MPKKVAYGKFFFTCTYGKERQLSKKSQLPYARENDRNCTLPLIIFPSQKSKTLHLHP
jgi:hypothetical protein